jgi:hypothetical protein
MPVVHEYPNIMTVIRAVTHNTGAVAQAILTYANHPGLKELRLAVTRAYRYDEDVPDGNSNNLLQNSPILQAVAVFDLPYTVNNSIAVVIDSPGLSMQRDARAGEVKHLTSDLLKLNLAPGKLTYAVVPVDAADHLPAEKAWQIIAAADYANFTRTDDETELHRRMQ